MRKLPSTRRTTALLLTAAIVGALTVATSGVADMVAPTLPAASAAPVPGGLGFTPLATPCRAADTRSGGGALSPDTTRSFQVGGTGSLAAQGGNAAGCGVPDGAGAVEVAITAVTPAGSGFLRAFAAGDAVPNATFVNYTSGVGITNTGTVPLAAAGTQDLSVRNFGGTTHVVVDVLGYFTTAGTGGYTPLASPCRAVDTRTAGGQLTSGAGAARNVQVAGTGAAFAAQGGTAGGCDVPDGVPAAVVSITAVGPVGSGFLRAGSNTGTSPAATVVNYTDAIGITNTGALPLGNAQTADLTLQNFGTAAHVVVDVLGYYSPAAGSRYQTVSPCRAVDTRSAPGGKLTPDTTRLFQVAGERNHFAAQGTSAVTGCGVPDRAAAVAAAVTAVSPDGNGFARLFPAGGAANGTFLNFTTGRSITNAGALSLANGGLQDLALKDFGASSHYVVDVLGYYEPPAANPNPAAGLGVGSFHACRVAVFGKVECWGANVNGRLGDGTTVGRSTPTPVLGLLGAVAVSAGSGHTCALIAGGTVKCWGYNAFGQLGTGSTTDASTPVLVPDLNGVVALSASGNSTCAVLIDQTARCWGLNNLGQLGDNTYTNRGIPTPVVGLTGAVSVGAFGSHTCAILSAGSAKCWGYNFYGQLGDGTTADFRPVPSTLAGLTGVTALAAGQNHTCALVSAGTVKCWGRNDQGQLGTGTTTNTRVPTTVSGLNGAVALSAGSDNTCAVLADGTAKCWGDNDFGQVGEGCVENCPNPVTLPTAVVGLTGAVAIGNGNSHTCALKSDGTSMCGGNNGNSQLGIGPFGPVPRLSYLFGVVGSGGATSISSGAAHTCALLSSGTSKCWGDNSNGQIGDSTTTDRLIPASVSGLTGVVALAAGQVHTCALIFDGTARCWGYNFYGQLGDGTSTARTTPTVVTGLTGAVAISAGGFHTCAHLADGSVKCWGDNSYGQVGDNTTANTRTVPTPVAGLTGVATLAAGGNHTCALVSAGTATCWGYNAFGQLGDGSSTSRKVPTSVSGLTGAVVLSAGGDNTCGVLADGTAKCWGNNTFGQIGDNTTSLRNTPTSVGSLSGAISISTGSHSCALLTSGEVRCWGYNLDGQIGDNTTTNRSAPVSTPLFNTVGLGIRTGGSHTCALTGSGTSTTGRCWGDNSNGQLGDGTTIDRLTATAVFGLG